MLFKNIIGKLINSNYLLSFLFFQIRYFFKKGLFINLYKQKTFSNKLALRKFKNRSPEYYTYLSDKIKMKIELSKILSPQLFVPNLYSGPTLSYEIINSIRVPFIIKNNHSSHDSIIIKDITQLSPKRIRKILSQKKAFYNFDFGSWSQEKWYSKITKGYLIEPLLIDKNGNVPLDYKIHYFKKTDTYLIMVDFDRFTNHSRVIYDKNWNELNYSIAVPYSDKTIQKPIHLQKMLSITKEISSFYNIDYYRLDFLIHENKFYINEVTFCESSAFLKYHFKKGTLKFDCDLLIGSYW